MKIQSPTISSPTFNGTVTGLSSTAVGLGSVTNNAQVKKITSSTDNAIVRWDGTSGDTPQNSGVTIDDNNNVSLPATYGSELSPSIIADNWTLGAGFTISNSNIIKSSNGTGTATTTAETTIVANTAYEVTLTVASLTVGALDYTLGSVSGTSITTDGTYTDIIVTNDTGKIIFSPSITTARYSITSVSIKAITHGVVASYGVTLDGIVKNRRGISILKVDPNGDSNFLGDVIINAGKKIIFKMV